MEQGGNLKRVKCVKQDVFLPRKTRSLRRQTSQTREMSHPPFSIPRVRGVGAAAPVSHCALVHDQTIRAFEPGVQKPNITSPVLRLPRHAQRPGPQEPPRHKHGADDAALMYGFLGAPCQEPPHYKLRYYYFSLILIIILLNKVRQGYTSL